MAAAAAGVCADSTAQVRASPSSARARGCPVWVCRAGMPQECRAVRLLGACHALVSPWAVRPRSWAVTPGSSRALLECHRAARASWGSCRARDPPCPGAPGPSRRRLQRGGAWRGSHHSCSAARASRGRLRPLPAPPGGVMDTWTPWGGWSSRQIPCGGSRRIQRRQSQGIKREPTVLPCLDSKAVLFSVSGEKGLQR
ncbi:unnamed protein product [Coccothraustes coccothraustes]